MRPPAGENGAAAGFDEAVHMLEGAIGIPEKHDAETRKQGVESGLADISRGGVASHETGIAEAGLFRAFGGSPHESRRDVEPGHGAARRDASGDLEAGDTRAAADIDHLFSRLESSGFDQRLPERRDHAFEAGVMGVPFLAHFSGPAVGFGSFFDRIGRHVGAFSPR